MKEGQVVNVAEYQDGRGFVLTASDLVYRLKDSLESRDKDTYMEIRSGISELLAALPSPLPPASPKIDAGAFFAVVSRIELAASRFN